MATRYAGNSGHWQIGFEFPLHAEVRTMELLPPRLFGTFSVAEARI